MTAKLMQYLRLLDEKKNAEVYSKEIDKDIQRLKALLIAEWVPAALQSVSRRE